MQRARQKSRLKRKKSRLSSHRRKKRGKRKATTAGHSLLASVAEVAEMAEMAEGAEVPDETGPSRTMRKVSAARLRAQMERRKSFVGEAERADEQGDQGRQGSRRRSRGSSRRRGSMLQRQSTLTTKQFADSTSKKGIAANMSRDTANKMKAPRRFSLRESQAQHAAIQAEREQRKPRRASAAPASGRRPRELP